MKRRFVVIPAALVIAVSICLGLLYQRKYVETKRTALEPSITLTDLHGRTFKASDYKGKVVLVNFWAAWCAPCAEEIPQFVILQNKLREQGLQIIGVSVEDDESELRDFCRRNNVNYPIIPGDSHVAEAFGGILGLPSTILIGKDGRIYKKYSGATDFGLLERDLLPLLSDRL